MELFEKAMIIYDGNLFLNPDQSIIFHASIFWKRTAANKGLRRDDVERKRWNEYKSAGRLVTCTTVDYTEAEQHECHTKYHRQCTNARNVTAQIALECGYSGLPALLPVRIYASWHAFSNFPLISISPTRGNSANSVLSLFLPFFFYFSPRCTHARAIPLLILKLNIPSH